VRRSSLQHYAEAAWPAIGTALIVVIVSLALAGRSAGVDETIIIGLINLVMVTGLQVFVGSSGVVSFGQVSFMAIGAYVCGMFTLPQIAKTVIIPNAPGVFLHTSLDTTTGVIVGGLVAAAVALVAAVPLMRLSGIGASIGTLALLMIVYTFFANWQPGSSGGGNLTRVPADVTVNSALLWAIAAVVVAFGYQRTRFGLRLRAAREDEVAARAVGVRVQRERSIAFTLSALMFGIAGGLYGHTVGSFSADDFFLPVTFMTLAMLIVGGSLSILGGVVGTGVLTLVSYVFDEWQNDDPAFGISLSVPAGTRDLVIALTMIAILLLRPDGLTGGKELPVPRWPRRRTGEPELGEEDGDRAGGEQVDVNATVG
jgi:branched-chain amino acid transport system permease protein